MTGPHLPASYDPALVALSVGVAVLASYVALDLTVRVSGAARGVLRMFWGTGGAIGMGCGIWSMHFIGMLALRLPVPVRYDVGLSVFSLFVAIVAAGLALALASRSSMSGLVVAAGGVSMGVAIAGMHYTGMAAMVSPVAVHYHNDLWWLSVGIAVAASCAALMLAFRYKGHDGLWSSHRATAALVMGAAIAGMHYTGMAAAQFTHAGDGGAAEGVLATPDLAVAVTTGTLLILGLAFLSAFVSVRQRRAAERQRRVSEDVLHNAAIALSETGDRFFPAVVRELVRTLGADFAIIGELAPDRPVVTCLSACHRGALIRCPEYELRGTPSERTVADGLWAYPSGVQALFPDDPSLARLNAQGYIGTPLTDTDGRPIGVMAVVTSSPLGREAHARALLQIFAARVSGELQRTRTERELRLSEQALVQAQKLDAIGRLAGGIAHDFNNLLAVVVGHAELLLDTMDGDRASQARIQQLLAATHKASGLTKHLLAFSRQQVLHPRPVQINDAARTIESMVSRTLGRNFSLSLRLDAALPLVMVDPVQLDQVLLNLIINARDAMPQGGTVTLATATKGDQVVVTVTDTGVGMDAATRARIFEPFFTTKGSAGTGLGLPTVYGIIKQSAGSVSCDSAPGAGTTFHISLPAATAAPETAARAIYAVSA